MLRAQRATKTGGVIPYIGRCVRITARTHRMRIVRGKLRDSRRNRSSRNLKRAERDVDPDVAENEGPTAPSKEDRENLR